MCVYIYKNPEYFVVVDKNLISFSREKRQLWRDDMIY